MAMISIKKAGMKKSHSFPFNVGLLACILLLCAGYQHSEITLSGEESKTPLTLENTGSFGVRPDIPTPNDIHRLTPSQEQDYLEYMNNPRYQSVKANKRMYNYLNKVSGNFSYEGITFNARETLAKNSGNCMSLAILTTALASLAELEIDYQLMDDVPVYEYNGATVKKGVHIRSIIYDRESIEIDGVYFLSRQGIKVDYFPTNRQRFIGNLDRDEYLAMIYQNLAAEALDQDNLNQAYWLAMEALHYVPVYSPAINTLAIANRRNGDMDTAELIYRYGINNADENLSLLKNYRILLENTDRPIEARQLQLQLNAMEDPSPFHWFHLAREALDAEEYNEAIRYFRKSLDLAPYLHEAHLGIAQANYELGRPNATRNALTSAYNEASKVSTKNLYQAKLAALSKELIN
jgi:Tfp pilus assembly protein PilF